VNPMTPTAIYALIAIIGTLFYGVGCFLIWGDAQMPSAHRWHQHWFNIAGATIGWIAGWPVFDHWFLLSERPTFAAIVLLLISFIGITGHLPHFLVTWGLTRLGSYSTPRPVPVPTLYPTERY
jgi:hypothetical protein